MKPASPAENVGAFKALHRSTMDGLRRFRCSTVRGMTYQCAALDLARIYRLAATRAKTRRA